MALTAHHLMLLDGVRLDPRELTLRLGPYQVRRYSLDELTNLMRGRDDAPVKNRERNQIELLSQLPWACIELQLLDENEHPKLAGKSQIALARSFWRTSKYWGSTEPFTALIRTLNLLKPSPEPAVGRVFVMRPSVHVQTKEQIETWGQFTADDDGKVPHKRGLGLGASDSADFDELFRTLVKYSIVCDPTAPRPKPRIRTRAANLKSNVKSISGVVVSKLQNAIHRFARGDDLLRPNPFDHDMMDPLMEFEAATEALLMREHERDTERRLSKRAAAVVAIQAAEHVRKFVKGAFQIRSKYHHASRSVYELSRILHSHDDAQIDALGAGGKPSLRPAKPAPSKRRTDAYWTLFARDGIKNSRLGWCNVALNMREIARQCIRYFLAAAECGRSYESVIDSLDSTAI